MLQLERCPILRICYSAFSYRNHITVCNLQVPNPTALDARGCAFSPAKAAAAAKGWSQNKKAATIGSHAMVGI